MIPDHNLEFNTRYFTYLLVPDTSIVPPTWNLEHKIQIYYGNQGCIMYHDRSGKKNKRCANASGDPNKTMQPLPSLHDKHMGVSKNRGTPKWMVYNGKPYLNGWFGGTIIFGNTQIEVDCRLSPWTSWGPCDRTCGEGQTRRFFRDVRGTTWGVTVDIR